MTLRVVSLAVAAATMLAAQLACANGSLLDFAYRADQPSFRLPAATADAALPRTLEEYQPPPAPPAVTAAAPEPAPATPLLYVWDRVRAGFSLDTLEGPLVAHWQAWYIDHPQLLKALFERSRIYIYYVTEEIEKRRLPSELAFLPMVESGYDPMALSSAQASGLWQFIPSTGRARDLKQNLLMDARRDIVASTAAALDYLQDLHRRFGDWQLALAAYNCGESCVASAIERNKARGLPAVYRALALPEETRNYLPKLQALKNIVADPGAFNIRIEPVPNKPYFAAIPNDRYIDVDIAARLAEMPLDEFVALNPGYKLNLISSGPRARIVLPVDKVETFLSNLDNYREPPKRASPATGKAPSKSKMRAPGAGARR
jgi:membrane-bound lytic murein transglycosylase D